jgi:lipid-A-disaccharide synthase
MKYYIIAGEASGDLHGSNLIKGLKQADHDAYIRFWGGDLMAAEAGTPVKHYRDTAIMGFWEVLTHLNKITENLKLCKEDILNYSPDVVILIDYPGFNFRIAKFAKKRGLKVFYYISPKVWAWKEGRIKKLRKYVDMLFIIFPFEIEYFRKHGISAVYNGNPLMDSISAHPFNKISRVDFLAKYDLPDKPYIALLAGSRKSEVEYMMPLMTEIEKRLPQYNFVLAAAPSLDVKIYENYLKNSAIRIIKNDTYTVLKHAKAAVVNSGTASLEAAIIGTPQVVCYGGSEISYQIAKRLVKVKYISLCNLILDKYAVTELIQHECTASKIVTELHKVFSGPRREKMLANYQKIREMLGGEGASAKVAKYMADELKYLNKNTFYTSVYESPIGRLKIICDKEALLSVTYMESNSPVPQCNNHPLLDETAKQLDEYFAEKRKVFDLPVKLHGTEFQKKVWGELAKIQYGKIKTYGELAKIVSSENAGRAVGLACKMNPIIIIIPCHRVLGANHELTGFAIGVDKKLFLLNHEKAYIYSDKNIFSDENQML